MQPFVVACAAFISAICMNKYVNWFLQKNVLKCKEGRLKYIAVNMFKANVLSILAIGGAFTPFVRDGMYSGQWPDPLVSLSVPMYMTLDIFGVVLLAKNNMAVTTLLHHACVTIGGIICLLAPKTASLDNAHAIYLTSVMVYGYLSSLLYIVNEIMAMKYDAQRMPDSSTMRLVGKLYAGQMSVNMAFQTYYMYRMAQTGNYLFLAMQVATIAGYVQDDLCLKRWLQKAEIRHDRVNFIVYYPDFVRQFPLFDK